MRCAILYQNVKNTHTGVLLLVKLQALVSSVHCKSMDWFLFEVTLARYGLNPSNPAVCFETYEPSD